MRHLQRLQGSRSSTGLPDTKNDEVSAENRWLSGFGHCAAEAYRFLSAVPGEGAERLARHLAAGLQKSRQTNSTVIISSSSIEETKVTLPPDTIIRGSPPRLTCGALFALVSLTFRARFKLNVMNRNSSLLKIFFSSFLSRSYLSYFFILTYLIRRTEYFYFLMNIDYFAKRKMVKLIRSMYCFYTAENKRADPNFGKLGSYC